MKCKNCLNKIKKKGDWELNSHSAIICPKCKLKERDFDKMVFLLRQMQEILEAVEDYDGDIDLRRFSKDIKDVLKRQ